VKAAFHASIWGGQLGATHVFKDLREVEELRNENELNE